MCSGVKIIFGFPVRDLSLLPISHTHTHTHTDGNVLERKAGGDGGTSLGSGIVCECPALTG